MPWVEVFAVLVVSHLVGDFILQTEFQAINKHGGLFGQDPVKRRALFSHAIVYTCAFIPALVWLGTEDYRAITLVALVLGIGVPHCVQDDGTAIKWWMRTVKHTEPQPGVLAILVDQCFHVVALMLTAILVGT
jgi:hypothetical protein